MYTCINKHVDGVETFEVNKSVKCADLLFISLYPYLAWTSKYWPSYLEGERTEMMSKTMISITW